MNNLRVKPTTQKSNEQRIDLKVCEACGALWLRLSLHGVYCRPCTLWLSDFPVPNQRGIPNASVQVRKRWARRRAVARRQAIVVPTQAALRVAGGAR